MIENKDYQSEFQKSLDVLEDIQYLSSFSVAPLLGQAYFHLSEFKRKADARSKKSISEFKEISKALDEKLELIVCEFFSNKSKFKSFEFKKDIAKIDLNKWNVLFEVLPEILSVVSLFNYHGMAEVQMNENRVLISGMVLQDSTLEMHRRLIYVITRKLLRKKVLLTFSLSESGRGGLTRLELKADISHQDDLIYKVLFKPSFQDQIVVGFSNIFCNYRRNFDDVKMLDEHAVIEILSDLSVMQKEKIPDYSSTESANKEFLHFPFLFRPISIILPIKGNLSTDPFLNLLDLGSMNETMREKNTEQKSKQDVSYSFHSIDFFSLFNT